MQILLYVFLLTSIQGMSIDIAVDKGQVSSGESIAIDEDSTYVGDILVKNNDAVIKGNVRGDVAVKEGYLKLKGKVRGDVALMNSKYDISGVINDGLISINSCGKVSGIIKGDVVLIGGGLNLDSAAIVEGDVSVIAGDYHKSDFAQLEGKEQISASNGFARWVADLFSNIFKGVGGLKTVILPASATNLNSVLLGFIFIALLYGAGLGCLYAFPKWQRRSRLQVERYFWKMLLTGVIFRVAAFAAVLIFVISVIGLIIIPFYILFWIFIALMAIPQTALWLGAKIKAWWKIKTSSQILQYSLGFVFLYLLTILALIFSLFGESIIAVVRILKVLGFLVIFVGITLGRGAIIYQIFFPKEARALD